MSKLHAVTDWFFPTSEGPTKQDMEKQVRHQEDVRVKVAERVDGITSETGRADGYLAAAERAFEQEKARKQSVETRLQGIFGLASIAGTIVFGSLIAIAAGSTPIHSIASRSLIVIGALYLTLQLAAAMLAAVRGLSRATYSVESLYELLPPNGTKEPVFLRDRIRRILELTQAHQLENNKKVTQMAVAHCAARNFVVGLVAFALFVSVIAIANQPQPPGACGQGQQNCPTVKLEPAIEKTNRVGLVHVATIGPFPVGEHKLAAETVLPCVKRALSFHGEYRLIGWQIIGRADKRELLPERAALYGSNSGLATARAIWVRDSVLIGVGGFERGRAAISTSGPTTTVARAPVDTLKSDRVVDVYVLLEERGVVAGKPAPPQPHGNVCS